MKGPVTGEVGVGGGNEHPRPSRDLSAGLKGGQLGVDGRCHRSRVVAGTCQREVM